MSSERSNKTKLMQLMVLLFVYMYVSVVYFLFAILMKTVEKGIEAYEQQERKKNELEEKYERSV